MQARRLFVALSLAAPTREELAQATRSLEVRARGGRFVRPELLHVTLKFLGSVEDDRSRVEAIQRALSECAARAQPAHIESVTLGGFPRSAAAHVLAAELHGADESLRNLSTDVDQALLRLGFAAEKRRFRPHVTLARFRAKSDVRSLAIDDVAPFVLDELVLYESKLGGEAPVYTAVWTGRLGKG